MHIILKHSKPNLVPAQPTQAKTAVNLPAELYMLSTFCFDQTQLETSIFTIEPFRPCIVSEICYIFSPDSFYF